MTSESGPEPPRIPIREPPVLVDGDSARLLDGDSYTAESYQRVDLSGRDLRHSTFSECAFDACHLTDTDLTRAHLIESDLSAIEAAHLRAPRSLWRHTALTRSRLGAVEAYEANLEGLVIADTKISYLNARASTWQDVLLRDCVVDELDLLETTLTRVQFQRCQIRSMDLSRATCRDVDLRAAELREIRGLPGLAGCTISPEQLYDLSGALAQHLGIRVIAATAP